MFNNAGNSERISPTRSPDSKSGGSGSRPSVHRSQSFEDVPFMPPPESDLPVNRQYLPQLYDRDPSYEHHHPYLPRRVAESESNHFVTPQLYSSRGSNTRSSRTCTTSQGALLVGPPRHSAHFSSASQSLISPSKSSRGPSYSPSRVGQIPDAGPALRQQLGLDPSAPVDLRFLPDPPPGKRPSQPLPLLTKLAIYGSPRKMLTLQEIYTAIEERFEWYKLNSEDKAWKNSIRHNLSLNKVFRAIQRPITEPGKGSYWCVDLSEGEGYKRPRKRRTKDRVGHSYTDGEAEESSEGDYESSPVDESSFDHGARYFQAHHVGEGRPRLGSRRSSPYHRSVSPGLVQADLSLHSGQGSLMNSSPVLNSNTLSSFGSPHGNDNVHTSAALQARFDQTIPISSYVQSSLAQPSLGQPAFMPSGSRQQGHTQSSNMPFHLFSAAPSVGAFMTTPTYFAPGHSTNLPPTSDMTTLPMHFMRGGPSVAQPAMGTHFQLESPVYRGQNSYETANRNDDFRTWPPEVFQARSSPSQYQTMPQGSQSSDSSSQASSFVHGADRRGRQQ